jgi:hypothetical protein
MMINANIIPLALVLAFPVAPSPQSSPVEGEEGILGNITI